MSRRSTYPMDTYDRELIEFAAEWAPYGGNDEEAFVRFGLLPEQFHARLILLLRTPMARTLTNTTADALRSQCRDRLSPSTTNARR
ncbi:DUF3263 domain-containing protein [Nocardia asteroides]|uniref:DUF3263 domain-containing protein n=1 Tax=Nocardia asteroides TaxID=1824 RepID=UPI00343A5835